MTRISKTRFAEMVEEATVDCYNDSEKITGVRAPPPLRAASSRFPLE